MFAYGRCPLAEVRLYAEPSRDVSHPNVIGMHQVIYGPFSLRRKFKIFLQWIEIVLELDEYMQLLLVILPQEPSKVN